MCASCETYEHSRNCGPRCEDHEYEADEELTAWYGEDGDVFYRCPRCGSCKIEESTT